MKGVIVREGWHQAEYGCPLCEDWRWYISSTGRLTTRRLHEDYGPRLDKHVQEKHPEPVPA